VSDEKGTGELPKVSTHLDDTGRAHMIDVGEKAETQREAIAHGTIEMLPETLASIKDGMIKKGDVLGVAQIAAVQAVKRTADLIPLCHPLRISGVEVRFEFPTDKTIQIFVTVRALDRTGVEMEALTAASVGLLTIYDMCKSVDRWMNIKELTLLRKSGGKSGLWERPE